MNCNQEQQILSGSKVSGCSISGGGGEAGSYQEQRFLLKNVHLESHRDLLVEEVKFLSGVSNEVKKVEADLRAIHRLLMEADSNRAKTHSPQLKNCIDELKELAFKAENVLETYAVEVESKKEGKSLKKKLQRFMAILGYSVHQVGDEIDDIRSRLADLTGSLSSISGGGGGEAASYQEQRRLLRLRYAHEVDQHFVGMEKDIRSLVLMVNDTESPSVVSICGMGGLGKTTLARKIYNHRDVQGSFDGRAWVCVTQQFQAETVLREIFQQIDGKKADKEATHDELVRELHSALVQRKCVIVIDDIWETNHWDILKPAFPTKNCKVVLTTRNQNVASQECHLHKLDFLSEDEGWELLGKIARPINHDATQVVENRSKSFEDIGRQMVKKCGRLPLAISVIGGILCQKQQILAEWEKVSSNMDSYLRHGGEGIGNDTRVKLVLDLSFDVLPYYLKPCFLYLSCFPEDEEIDTQQLYRLWLAEGLISWEEKGDNETLRDVAERYLTELASRCMVQLEKRDISTPHDKFESCRLHDLMLDLCLSKAVGEKFIKRVDISKHEQDIPSAIGASIHRLAINLDVDDDDDPTLGKIFVEGLKDLRSFLVLCKRKYEMTTIDFMNFENSKHLRILSLDRAEFEDGNLPITIGKLIYLKYLSLCWCNVKELPQYVCHLPYLQTLDLRAYNTIKLPNIFSRMKRLRHLFLRENIEVIGGDKLKLDGLNELETLEGINSKNACIEDIVNLMNLRRLVATFENDTDSLSKIVDYMSSNGCQLRETQLIVESCDLRNVVKKMLMSRSLVCLRIDKCEIGCMFPSYEQGMCPCPNLFKLIIENCEIEGDVVEVLGKCPMLQFLWLEGGVGEVEKNSEMRFGPNSFPELKDLYLTAVSNLRKWEVEEGAMIKLRELLIDRCRDLEKLPDGLRCISSVERVTCIGMSEEFKGRMRRGENGEGGGQDYANFSHIPNLYVF